MTSEFAITFLEHSAVAAQREQQAMVLYVWIRVFDCNISVLYDRIGMIGTALSLRE